MRNSRKPKGTWILATAFVTGLLAMASCSSSDVDRSQYALVHGVALSGPTCPVDTDPPSPSCLPRPVPDAEVVVANLDSGAEVRTRTDSEGIYSVSIEPGRVRVSAKQVDGLLGTPDAVDLDASPVGVHRVDLMYDTGIR